LPEVGDVALSRQTVVRLAGDVPKAARTLTFSYAESFGSCVLRVRDGVHDTDQLLVVTGGVRRHRDGGARDHRRQRGSHQGRRAPLPRREGGFGDVAHYRYYARQEVTGFAVMSFAVTNSALTKEGAW
jgi:hypothetical protein